MPLSYVQTPANGVTDLFNVPFPYLSRSHVQVKINGVIDTGVTFLTEATLKTSSIPANGTIVEVRRITPRDVRLVDFADGSLLGETVLDKSALQLFYVMQEVLDDLIDRLALNSLNVWDALGKRLSNLAAGVTGSDAATVGQVQSLMSAGALPSGTGHAGQYLRQKLDESGLEYPTVSQTRSDLGLPSLSGNGSKYVRVNAAANAYEARSKAETQTDLGLPNGGGASNLLLQVNPAGDGYVGLSQVTSGLIADATITTAKLADANVTSAKLADASVSAAKLGNGAVTEAKLEVGLLGKGYIMLQEQQATGVAGGTFTNGAWRTRAINTEVTDTGNHCTLSGNQFTLAAGTYRLGYTFGFGYAVGGHRIRLLNVTDGTTLLSGGNTVANQDTFSVATSATMNGRFTIGASKVLELQHQCGLTKTVNGFGLAHAFTGTPELYAQVELFKEV